MREILNLIENPIVVLANGVDPLNREPREGYHQRVAAVDTYIGDRNRVYIKATPGLQGAELVRHLGRKCIEIEIGDDYSLMLANLMRRAAGIYSHSIYPLFHPTIRELVSGRSAPLILDMHGVVPEEIDFIEHSSRSSIFERLESWATLEADALVHVSNRMAAHFKHKYPWVTAQHIVCPIFVERSAAPQSGRERGDTIVYAGGAQPWQQVDHIVDAMAAGLPRYHSRILTHQPQTFIEKFEAKGVKPDGEMLSVHSARPDEVWNTYEKSRFGILCREDHVINRVACPTKLVEYLYAGLVPVMGTPTVGDFVDLGMEYVSIDDVAAHALPNAATCSEMAARNLEVLNRLSSMAADGREAVLTLFAS